MQLYFIRHGQSINNVNAGNPAYIENPDPPLTEMGHRQAQLLAQYLHQNQPLTGDGSWNAQNQHGFGLTHLYCSLMERAAFTAHASARLLELPFSAWVDLHEEGGIFPRLPGQQDSVLPGRTRTFFETHLPLLHLPDALGDSGWWNRPFETEDHCQARAEKVLAELLARHGNRDGQPQDRVALFGHGAFFMRLLCAMLRLPWRQAAHGMKSWFLLNNCSISRFDIHPDWGITVCYLNRTTHLPPELITE